jgi:hypothetical protein
MNPIIGNCNGTFVCVFIASTAMLSGLCGLMQDSVLKEFLLLEHAKKNFIKSCALKRSKHGLDGLDVLDAVMYVVLC